ncbi:MAG: hypothetical protein ACOX4U_02455 [Anaerovoracaceae bacterium]
MGKRKFTVIKGGADGIPSSEKLRFVSAYVTDTRLMGVTGLYIHWRFERSGEDISFHQFFYYDSEEYGLETYRSLVGNDSHELELMEKNLIGGLGGVKVDVSEREARFLVQHFIEGSKKLKAPLAEPKEEYIFLDDEPVIMSERQLNIIMGKICTPLKSNYHLINYFLMRCFALDIEAMEYLSEPGFPIKGICGDKPSTLCKNTITPLPNDNGSLSYLCEALIETENRYKLMVIEIEVRNGKVVKIIAHSDFYVTITEAAMMLNRNEYITVYEIIATPDNFDDAFIPFTAGALQTTHNNGRLFLEFNKTNDHVNRQVFRLNEDIQNIYYVSDYGQLLLVSYDLSTIRQLERKLRKGNLATMLFITARYEFKEPILYEFIQSDFEDFGDFLLTLQD